MKKELEKKTTKNKKTTKKEDKKVIIKKTNAKKAKKKEKKGFTLTELLVIVAIILVIVGLSVFGYSKITLKQKQKALELVHEEIYLAAEEYMGVNEYVSNDLAQSGEYAVAYISVGALVKFDYLNALTDPMTGKEFDGNTILKVSKDGSTTILSKEEADKLKDQLGDNYENIINGGGISGGIEIIDPSAAKIDIEIWKIDASGKEIEKINEFSRQNNIQSDIPLIPVNDYNGWYNKLTTPNGVKIKIDSTRSISVTKNGVEVTGSEFVLNADDPDGIYEYVINYGDNKVTLQVKIDRTVPTITASNNIVTTGTLPWTNENASNSTYQYVLNDATSGLKTIDRHYNSGGLTESEAKSATYKWNGTKYPNSTNKTEEVTGFYKNGTTSCVVGDKSCTYKGTYGSYADGYRLSKAKVCDVAGNCSAYSNELTIGIDRAAVTSNLVMKQNSSRAALTTADDYASLKNYTNDTWYNGWVFTTLELPKVSLSGITASCKDVRTNGQTYDDFVLYRNIGTNGIATITCNAQNKAGTKAPQLVRTIKIDMTVPELDIIAKLKTNETNLTDASNYASLANYTNNTWTKGYVFVKPVVTANVSSATVTCIDSRYAANSADRTFSLYRNVNTEGFTTIECYATNEAGTKSAAISKIIKLDRTVPVCGTNNGTTAWTNQNRTITQNCSDTYSGCNSVSKTFSSDVTTAGITIMDGAGNMNTCTANVYVDKTAPTCTDPIGQSTSWIAGNRTITQGCSDNLSGCNSIGNQTYTSTASTAAFNGKVITDKAGNSKTCGNYTVNVYVDKTAPNVPSSILRYDSASGTQRTNTDQSWTNKTLWWGNFSAADTGSGTSYYQWSTNCSGSVNGTLGTSYTYSTNNNVAYCVRAVDNVGNASAWSAATYIKIDKNAPTCTSSGGSTTWAKSRTLTGTCSDTGGSGCKGNVTYNITWNTNSTTVSPGTVYDNAGNYVSCPANQTVKVDVTPPTCSAPIGQSTSWTNGSRTLTQGCSDNLSGCNSLGTYACPANVSSTSLSNLVITDVAGNSTTCGSYTVNCYRDTTAPTCSSSGGSTSWTNGNRTLTGTCSDTGGSGCKGNVTKSFTTTTNLSNQSPGTVYDYAGNSVTCPANQTVKIDKNAPSTPGITYNGGANSCTWKNNYNITLSSTDNVSLSYFEVDHNNDGVADSTTGSNFIPGNGYSSCNVRFRAVDHVTNKSAWTGTNHIHMDTANPSATTVKFNSGSNSCVWQSNYNITLTATDNVGISYYEVDKNGDGVADSTTGSNFIPSNGYSGCGVRFRAVDHAGNKGAWTGGYHIHMDTTGPGATTVKYNSGNNTCSWKNNYNITLSATDNVGIAHYEIDWSGDGVADTTTGANFIPWNSWNACNTRFRAVDHAGNKGAWTGGHHIHMDTQAPGTPTITYNGGSNSCSWKNNYNITLSSSDNIGISYYEVDHNNDGGVDSTTGANFIPGNGYHSHNVRFRAVDSAGNRSGWTAAQHIHQDTGAPSAPTTMSFVYGDWSTYGWNWTNQNIFVARTSSATAPTGSTDDVSGISKYQISADGSTWYDYAYDYNSWLYALTSQGTHVRYFRAVDYAGNVSSSIVRYAYIDKTAPAAPTVELVDGTWTAVSNNTWYNKNIYVSGQANSSNPNPTASDNLSGISYYQISTDNANWSTWSYNSSSSTYKINWDGTTYRYIRAVDNAGNVSAVTTKTIKRDTVAPTISTFDAKINPISAAQNAVNLRWATSDATSGIKSVATSYENKNGTKSWGSGYASWNTDWSNTMYWPLKTTAEGSSLTFTVTDNAGNTAKTKIGVHPWRKVYTSSGAAALDNSGTAINTTGGTAQVAAKIMYRIIGTKARIDWEYRFGANTYVETGSTAAWTLMIDIRSAKTTDTSYNVVSKTIKGTSTDAWCGIDPHSSCTNRCDRTKCKTNKGIYNDTFTTKALSAGTYYVYGTAGSGWTSYQNKYLGSFTIE